MVRTFLSVATLLLLLVGPLTAQQPRGGLPERSGVIVQRVPGESIEVFKLELRLAGKERDEFKRAAAKSEFDLALAANHFISQHLGEQGHKFPINEVVLTRAAANQLRGLVRSSKDDTPISYRLVASRTKSDIWLCESAEVREEYLRARGGGRPR